jgi:hypothetical protein
MRIVVLLAVGTLTAMSVGCGGGSSARSETTVAMAAAGLPTLPKEVDGAALAGAPLAGISSCKFDSEQENLFECADGSDGSVDEGLHPAERPQCSERSETRFVCRASNASVNQSGVSVEVAAKTLPRAEEIMGSLYRTVNEFEAAPAEEAKVVSVEDLTACLESGGVDVGGVKEGLSGSDGTLVFGAAPGTSLYGVVLEASNSLLAQVAESGVGLPELESFAAVPGNPSVLVSVSGADTPDPAAVAAGAEVKGPDEVLALIDGCAS